VPISIGQMRGSMGGSVSGSHGGFALGPTSGSLMRNGARSLSPGFILASPFFESDYRTDEPQVIEGAPLQVVVVQAPATGGCPGSTGPKPLLIEWRGDRYVRFGGADEAGDCGTPSHPDYVEPTITRAPLPVAQKKRDESPAAESQTAALVFRDGHREEISDYAIADGVIYVRGNFWQNGYWTKLIPLSALDLSSTMQANQQRGAKFLLPFAPNVVVASF